jgi:twitching motility protein PilT
LQGIVSQNLLKRADGSGRVGGFEILVGTNAVRNLIRENQIAQIYSMIQTGSRYGMITMEDSIKALVEQGVVDQDEARRVLMKSTDEGGEHEEGVASASLGGGRLGQNKAGDVAPGARKAVATGKGGGKSGGDDSGEGYSF